MPIVRLGYLLEASDCATLAPTLVLALRRSAGRGERVDDAFAALVGELSTIARVYRNSIADGRQPRHAAIEVETDVCHDWIGSEVAAAMLGVRARRARQIVATMPGAHKVGGAWRVERGSVEKLREARGL